MKKHFLYTVFYCAIFALILSACRNDSDVNRILDSADSLMDIRPDSALCLLDSLDSSALSGEPLARYALLFNKAKFKNHIPETNDSLINIAVDFYKGWGDSLEIQSLYYKGAIKLYAGDSKSALLYLHQAYDLAFENNYYFYSALSARELSFAYSALKIIPKELEWVNRAKELFHKADKPVHEAWMDIMLMDSYLYSGLYGKALDICNNVDSVQMNEDVNFRQLVLFTKAETLSFMGRFHDSVDQYQALIDSGYDFSAHHLFRLADSYLSLDDGRNAELCLGAAMTLPMAREDSLYMYKIKSLVCADKGEYKDAFTAASAWANLQSMTDLETIVNPQTLPLTDSYRNQAESQSLKAEKRKEFIVYLSVLVVLLVVALIFILLYFRARMANGKLEAEKTMAEVQILRDDLEFKKRQLNESCDVSSQLTDERRLMQEREQAFRSEISGLFSRHMQFLDELCNVWYRNGENIPSGSSRLDKEVLATVKRLQDIEVVEELAAIIDKYNDGWMSKFKEAYSDLSDSDYLLSMYLYLGFKSETIVVLMNRRSTNAVHTAKYKLKMKLLARRHPDEAMLLSKIRIL